MVKGQSLGLMGRIIVGEFNDGKFKCDGELTWSDGTKYVGEWKNGRRDGQ